MPESLGVDGGGPQNLGPPTRAISPRKIFMIFQTALLRKPECDKRQRCDDVKRNCSWTQGDRSEFRRRICHSTAVTASGVSLHANATASTGELS